MLEYTADAQRLGSPRFRGMRRDSHATIIFTFRRAGKIPRTNDPPESKQGRNWEPCAKAFSLAQTRFSRRIVHIQNIYKHVGFIFILAFFFLSSPPFQASRLSATEPNSAGIPAAGIQEIKSADDFGSSRPVFSVGNDKNPANRT